MEEHACHSSAKVNDWYAVYCKVGREQHVSTILNNHLHIHTYLPELRTIHKGNRSPRPFFPGYLFIQTNFEKIQVSDIHLCPGVHHIIVYNGKPQPIPHATIAEIRNRLEQFNASGQAGSQKFQSGEHVHITTGPLEGLEAVFLSSMKSHERVIILLNFLGRLSKAQIEISALERIQELPKTLKQRYTRGNGRKIHVANTLP